MSDYPELAEPHNNLAVIYASRGDYSLARTELETAISLNPGYATAFENLGDVYARLASQQYALSARAGGNAPRLAAKQRELAQVRQSDLARDDESRERGQQDPAGERNEQKRKGVRPLVEPRVDP